MDKDKVLNVRLPAALLAKVDAFTERLAKSNPGMNPSRGQAVRILIERAIAQDLNKKARLA